MSEFNPLIYKENIFADVDFLLKNPEFDAKKYNKTKRMAQQFKSEISKYSPKDQCQISDALVDMLTLHKDQKDRPDGSPYVIHPLEVARDVINLDQSSNPDLVITALLHDSIEDQSAKLAMQQMRKKYGKSIEKLSSEDLEKKYDEEVQTIALAKIAKKYGEKIAENISYLSNPNFDKLLQLPENQGKSKNDLYKEHIEKIIKDPDLFIIKLADFAMNGTNLAALPEGPKKDKLTKKYLPVFNVFINRLQQDNSLQIDDEENIIRRFQKTKNKLLNNEKENL